MPFSFLESALRHRGLIARLTRSRLEARYRGSVFGWLWMWILPLFMLSVYTFVFGEVFQARWGALDDGRGTFPLILFSGLLIYGLLAECWNEAPGLLAAHQPYLKQSLFPSEILAWVSLGAGAVRLGAGLFLLIAARWIVLGPPPLSVLWLPLAILPVALITLGGVWILSSLGVFFRDLSHGIPVATTALLFLSPIFYPASHVPETLQRLFWWNPLTPSLEAARNALFEGVAPEWLPLTGAVLMGWLLAWAGFAWFTHTKATFVDVL